jgi:hypothetical protein
MKTVRLFWLLGFFISISAIADTFYVEGANSSFDDEKATAVELIQSAVAELGHKVVDDPAKAEFTLRPRLMRLGSAYILKLEKRKAGVAVFSSQLKAQQLEELDRVAKRLTRSVIKNSPADDDARVGEITNEEATQGVQRRPAVGGVHFALGPVFLANSGTSGVGYGFTLGKSWDLNNALILIRADVFGQGSAFAADLGLAGHYFLLDTKYAPFVGGEFGFGGIRQNTGTLFSDDFHLGFFLGPIAGVQLFRTSTVQLELAVRWSIMLQSTTLGRPSVLGFRVGLYF